jgi:hypothetical protein
MRIDANGRVIGARQAGGAKPGDRASTFSLDLGESAPEAQAARSAPAVASLDAMLALQGAEDPTEKRRRQVRRGRRLLDALDDLKLALLEGREPATILSDLAMLARSGREAVDDPRLESVLAEIDLRAAVEIAKRQSQRDRQRERGER